MRLLIVSHTEHYRRGDTMVGWGPTVREIDQLTSLFEEIVHIATLCQGPPPESALAYESHKVRLHLVPPAGGEGLRAKLGILTQIPIYLRTIRQELRQADAVHVRCPANISLLAIFLLAFMRRPKLRWAKYAGNWHPEGREARSYTFQRWWLKKGFHRGVTTVNGQWPHQPAHVHAFLNPCLTEAELQEAKEATVTKEFLPPFRLLLVGRLEAAKGVGRALEIMDLLRQRNIPVVLDLIGDGPERQKFCEQIDRLSLTQQVHLHGWLPRPALSQYYARTHILLFPTDSEGWPKVLSEAMAYRVVPVCSNVSSIPQYLARFGTGHTCAPNAIQDFADAIQNYVENPEQWKKEAENASCAAEQFSYANYLTAVRSLLFHKEL